MKKMLLALTGFLLLAGAAFAGGQFTDYLPTYATPTGQERLPVDTNLSQGRMPQTVFLTINQVRSGLMQQSTPLTGFSITAAEGTTDIQITPAGTLAAGTVVFPSAVTNGFRLRIFSSQIVTTLTLTAGAGQTIIGGVTTLAANVPVEYMYQASNLSWYRVN